MTKKQTQLYWREWSAARKMLIRHGYSSTEADQQRHNLTAQALGAPKSSKGFTNRDLDLVLAAFRAVSRPDDLKAQLAAEDQPRLRVWHQLWKAAQKQGLTKQYLTGISKQMFGKHIDDCDPEQLKRIIVALRYHEEREFRKESGDTVPGIQRGTGTPWGDRKDPDAVDGDVDPMRDRVCPKESRERSVT